MEAEGAGRTFAKEGTWKEEASLGALQASVAEGEPFAGTAYLGYINNGYCVRSPAELEGVRPSYPFPAPYVPSWPEEASKLKTTFVRLPGSEAPGVGPDVTQHVNTLSAMKEAEGGGVIFFLCEALSAVQQGHGDARFFCSSVSMSALGLLIPASCPQRCPHCPSGCGVGGSALPPHRALGGV